MPLHFISCNSLMLRLFDIAFHSRCSLPLLISAGLMIFDLHLQIELEVEARVQRDQQPVADHQIHPQVNEEEEPAQDEEGNYHSGEHDND